MFNFNTINENTTQYKNEVRRIGRFDPHSNQKHDLMNHFHSNQPEIEISASVTGKSRDSSKGSLGRLDDFRNF